MKPNKILLFVLLTLVLSSLAFASVPVDNVTSYFKLDETTGTNAFDSAGSYNGTASNSRIFTSNTGTSGKINSGADFTQGDDSIALNSNVHDTTIDGTIAYWFNSASLTGIQVHMGLLAQRDFRLYTDGTKYTWRQWTSLAGTSDVTFSGLSTSTWYHVVAVKDGNTARLYINGQLEDTNTIGAVNDLSVTNALGYRVGVGSYYNGFMDEVLFSDIAFNSTEVLDLYNAQKDGFTNGQYPTFGVVDNFTITAKDFYDDTTIETFNATVNNTFYSTTNGTITLPFLDNETVQLNITVEAIDYVPYINTSYDTSNGNLEVQLSLSFIPFKITAIDSSDNSSIMNFSASFVNISYSFEGGYEGWTPIGTTTRSDDWSSVGDWSVHLSVPEFGEAWLLREFTLSNKEKIVFDTNIISRPDLSTLRIRPSGNSGLGTEIWQGSSLGETLDVEVDLSAYSGDYELFFWVNIGIPSGAGNFYIDNVRIDDVYSTTNGTIITPLNKNAPVIANILISSDGYFTNNYTNYLTDTDINASLTPLPLEDFLITTANNTLTLANELTINWTQAISPSGKAVSYNVTFNNTTYQTSDLYYTLNLTNLNANVYEVEVKAIEDITNNQITKSINILVDKLNYLYFFEENSGTPLSNATITIDFPNLGTDLPLSTDTQGKVEFNSFQSNILQTGNYSITFEDFVGYETPITFTRTYNTLPINESFNISVTNINIQIYYRLNNLPFNETANVIIQGLGNFTTSNGSILIQNATISQGIYYVYVFADGYFNEQREITYTSQDSLNISFYMAQLNQSNSGTVTIRAIDDFQRLIQNAKINLLEYQPQQLSYIVVSQCFTDSNGECKFLIETNTKTYKFTAEAKNNGDIISAETNPQVFSDDVSGGQIVLFSEQTITITLSFIERYSLNPINNIIYNITESYNEITKRSQINTYWRTIDGTDITICLEYFQIVNSMKVSLTGSTFCSTSSEGQIIPPNGFTLNDTKTYVADVYIQNGRILLESYRYNSIFSFEQMLKNNATLPFVVLLLWIGIIAGGMMFRNIPLTGIGIIVFAWIIAYIFPSYAITSISVLQTLIGLGLIYNGRKKEDFQ